MLNFNKTFKQVLNFNKTLKQVLNFNLKNFNKCLTSIKHLNKCLTSIKHLNKFLTSTKHLNKCVTSVKCWSKWAIPISVQCDVPWCINKDMTREIREISTFHSRAVFESEAMLLCQSFSKFWTKSSLSASTAEFFLKPLRPYRPSQRL